MHQPQDYLAGLFQLHGVDDLERRRALWRQGMASLAAAAADQQPGPLEGMPQDELVASARVALSTGLVDELDFLSRPIAAAALFELAAALPAGPEKRDIGRRVLVALHEGDAATFVALATALALTSRRALAGPAVRARVALSLRLPISSGTAPDRLALALLSRPDLEREWVTVPSTGALPSRRLTARLLERAAREAVRRAGDGDPSGLRVFDRAEVKAAWDRMLFDRESLVWRHLATARGLLAARSADRALEIERELNPELGPGEWRRAAASLGAHLAHDPDVGLARCRDVLGSEIARRDPGVAAAMIFGLVRAAEAEPEAAEALLPDLVRAGGVDAVEALVDLREEHPGSPIGGRAAEQALEKLRAAPRTPDDGLVALSEALRHDLDPEGTAGEPPLRTFLGSALVAFTEGRRLPTVTEAALQAARAALARLESSRDDTPDGRRETFRALRDLDMGLLETSILSELLSLAARDPAPALAPLGEIFGRMGAWLLEREQKPQEEGRLAHFTLRLRRLRTLLHLFDVDNSGSGEDGSPAARDRRRRSFLAMTSRLRSDPPSSPLRRTLCATVARAADALVRDEICELGDVFIAMVASARTADDLRVLSEASIIPEAKEMFAGAAEAARPLGAASGKGAPDTTGERDPVEALRTLAGALPPGASARIEGMRRALLGTTRALQAIGEARALSDFGRRTGPTPLERLDDSVRYAGKLVAGARRRLGMREGQAGRTADRDRSWDPSLRDLDAAIERAVRGLDEPLGVPVAASIAAIQARLPRLIAEVITIMLGRIPGLPRERAPHEVRPAPAPQREMRLPPWLPPSRIVGGFYVVRPLGTGAGGSVFVVRRAEERHHKRAETFALKVPAYNGAAAHTLSEAEFLQLFREEAGALLTLPKNANLAGFVTFDAGARPKPILVMELVGGPTLERLIDKRELTVPFAMSVLDGIAGGLEAMHGAGVAHLDLKPGNIILRAPKGTAESRLASVDSLGAIPVLVDFGLAGRKIRPGCGSPYYGGPEVWRPPASGATDPRAADVYAFCCLAFELLTGWTLFEADALPDLLAAHLTHDGDPPRLSLLRKDPQLATVADVLQAGLARDPRRRAAIDEVRAALATLASDLDGRPWPVAAPELVTA